MGMLDPFQMWRDAVNLIEDEVNSFAARKMESAEFAKAANQFSKVSIGMQHVLDRSVASVLRRLELPSRAELDTLAASVQRIEDKLDQLLPVPVTPSVAPKPSRTRRPLPPSSATQAAAKPVKRALKPATRRGPKED
ncbi:TPA: hypothetical protein SAN82_002584 [Pseudomonas putida]|nr:hypothetical protein [Pseudomonas putida]